MRVHDYVAKRNCEKSLKFSLVETEDRRYLVIESVLNKVCDLFKKGAVTQEALNLVGKSWVCEVEDSFAEYTWVSDTHKEEQFAHDRELYQRLWGFLQLELSGSSIISTNHRVYVEYEGETLEQKINLLFEKNGTTYGIIFYAGANKSHSMVRQSGMSKGGKNPYSRVDSQPELVVAKCGLEKKYKNTVIMPVFFSQGDVKGEIEPFNYTKTQKANVFYEQWEDCCYTDGQFDEAVCMSKMHMFLAEMSGCGQSERCKNCYNKGLCQMQTVSKRDINTELKKQWVMPTYDASQEELVHFGHGTMLCTAGPGSGKTASMVGRVKEFGKSVPTEQMLILTFTEKAAGEFRDRIECVISEDEMPVVCTVHAIGMEIIRTYEKARNLPPSNLAVNELPIIEKLLTERTQLKGVDYRNFTKGPYSTIRRVLGDLKTFREEPGAVLSRNESYDLDEWEELSDAFSRELRESHCISYDDVIANAVEILQTQKDILTFFHNTYRYIMVDEYQDIEEKKEELIRLLVTNGELVVIGDKDQAIFRFTGCDSKFIKEFPNRYPAAKVVALNTNYRSTGNIIRLSDSVLNGKVDHRGAHKVGKMPVFFNQCSYELVDGIIKDCLKRGYQERQIAVLSRKWDRLEVLQDNLSVKTEVARAFLVNDFLFRLVYFTLGFLMRSDVYNNCFGMGLLMERPDEWFVHIGEFLEGNYQDETLTRVLRFCESNRKAGAVHYVSRLAASLNMDETRSEKSLLELIRKNNIKTTEELYANLRVMVQYEDDSKIDYSIKNAVTLTTSHSAKGKEWDVIILLDAESYGKDLTEEESNLLYVSLSRAKEELYVLKDGDKDSVLDENPYLQRMA